MTRDTGQNILSPRISVRQLTYLVMTAREQSVSRAADVLHVSAPTISAAISRLEELTGVQLFVRRHARGMVLTPAGKELELEARNVLQQIEEMETRHRSKASSMQGRIDIGCLMSFAPYLVPPMMRSFSEQYPGVELRFHEGDHGHVVSGLTDGRFELGLTYDYELPSSIIAEEARKMPTQVALPAGDRMYRKKGVALAELADRPFILLDHPATRDYYLSIFNRLGLKPDIAHRTASYEMVRHLVANDFGYSLLNFCPRHHTGSGSGVVGCPLVDDIGDPALVLGRLYHYRLNPITRTFSDFVIEHISGLDFSMFDELAADVPGKQ